MFSASIADRSDWRYSYYLAGCDQASPILPELVVRERCPICRGPLLRSQKLVWCSQCQTVADIVSSLLVTRRFSNRLHRSGSDSQD